MPRTKPPLVSRTMPALLGRDDVLALLSVSAATLDRLIRHHGFPPGTRLGKGGRRRWRCEPVARWIRTRYPDESDSGRT